MKIKVSWDAILAKAGRQRLSGSRLRYALGTRMVGEVIANAEPRKKIPPPNLNVEIQANESRTL